MGSIFDILKRLVKRILKEEDIYSKTGTIISVNTTNRVCTVKLQSGEQIDDVKLLPTYQGNYGILITPIINTACVVTFIDRRFCFLNMVNEIDTYYLTANEINFNGGTNAGLININEIVTKMNGLITEITALKLHINTHVHSGVTAGSTVSGTATPFTGSFSNFNKNDFEDTKIIH